MFWLCAVWACGSSPKREVVPDMTEPAWADEYAKRAEAGCGCADATCLEAAHTELAAIMTKHGGFDDAPQGVHVAHGKFDTCWRDGTRDIGRDFERLAQTICSCTKSECLRLAQIEQASLVNGKYRDNLDAELAASPVATAAVVRANACLAKVMMPAALAVEVFTTSTHAMCACKDMACAASVMKQREAALSKWIDMDPSVDRTSIANLASRWCDCMERVAVAEIKGMSPVPTFTSVSVDLNCR